MKPSAASSGTTIPTPPPQVSVHERRIRELDGLRGLAVSLVMTFHFLFSDKSWLTKHVAGAGWIGVDLFFVLSGFLITRILLASIGSQRFFLNFYARRALRIWPLYFVTIAFAFFGTLVLPPRQHIDLSLLPYYATFTQNLFRPNHFGPWAISGTWSLAIEEQFYLLWPLCVSRLPGRTLVQLLTFLVLSTPITRVLALAAGVTPCTVHLSSLMRVDDLACGALAAMLFDSGARAHLQRLAGTIGGPILCLGLVLSGSLAGHDTVTGQSPVALQQALLISATYSLLAMGFAALVVLAASPQFTTLGRLLRNPALRFLGRISFGLYLIQGAVIPLTQTFVRPWVAARFAISGMRVTAIVIVVGGLTSLLLAVLSWRLLESPALRLRRYFTTPSPSTDSSPSGVPDEGVGEQLAGNPEL